MRALLEQYAGVDIPTLDSDPLDFNLEDIRSELADYKFLDLAIERGMSKDITACGYKNNLLQDIPFFSIHQESLSNVSQEYLEKSYLREVMLEKVVDNIAEKTSKFQDKMISKSKKTIEKINNDTSEFQSDVEPLEQVDLDLTKNNHKKTKYDAATIAKIVTVTIGITAIMVIITKRFPAVIDGRPREMYNEIVRKWKSLPWVKGKINGKDFINAVSTDAKGNITIDMDPKVLKETVATANEITPQLASKLGWNSSVIKGITANFSKMLEFLKKLPSMIMDFFKNIFQALKTFVTKTKSIPNASMITAEMLRVNTEDEYGFNSTDSNDGKKPGFFKKLFGIIAAFAMLIGFYKIFKVLFRFSIDVCKAVARG